MPTTVHIPADLLEAVDRRAKDLKMSRNRFIVEALRRVLDEDTSWSSAFVEALLDVEPGDERLVDEMMEAIRSSRRSKAAPDLE
jgi:predicted transcriptional regulator